MQGATASQGQKWLSWMGIWNALFFMVSCTISLDHQDSSTYHRSRCPRTISLDDRDYFTIYDGGFVYLYWSDLYLSRFSAIFLQINIVFFWLLISRGTLYDTYHKNNQYKNPDDHSDNYDDESFPFCDETLNCIIVVISLFNIWN